MRKNTDIKLNGDVAYKPLWKTFYRNSDFEIATLATLFGVMAVPSVAYLPVIFSAGFYAAANVTDRTLVAQLLSFLFKNQKDICIDTEPDNQTPPTSPENMLKALFIRKSLQSRDRFIGTGCVAYLVYDQTLINNLTDSFSRASYGEFAITLGGIGASIGVYIERARRHQIRFKNVLDGTWVMKDLPPPEPVSKSVKNQVEELPVPTGIL